MSNPWCAQLFRYELVMQAVLSLYAADINGQLPTVITLPAFSIDVVYLKTRSRSVHAGRQSASTACVLDAGPVPPVPLQVQGQALVPSILPIARTSWTLPRTATRSRAQFRPEPEAISIELVRRWQTWAVDPHGNGTCCTTFNFTIPCRFSAAVDCTVGLLTHPRHPTGTLHPHHLYCHISLRQVEDPDEQARSWPPSPKIHWELRAMFNGVVEPVLDVLLRFEPRVRRQ
jgi:hypothetical protein